MHNSFKRFHARKLFRSCRRTPSQSGKSVPKWSLPSNVPVMDIPVFWAFLSRFNRINSFNFARQLASLRLRVSVVISSFRIRVHPCLSVVKLFCVLLLASASLLTNGCSKKSQASRHVARADKYFASSDYSKAEIEYLNALQLGLATPRIIGRLGTIYYEEGRLSRAFPFLTKASELAPKDMDLHIKLATIYLSAGKVKECREQANVVLEKTPTNSDAPLLLAESVSSRTDLDNIRKQLEAFVGFTNTAPFQTAFGTLFFRERNLDAAASAFHCALKLDPKNAAAHHALGMLYFSRQDLTNAASELKIASDLSPIRSNRRVRYADFKIKIGELEEGKRLLADLTKQAPDYLPAWTQQAEIALAEKKYDDCASLLNQVLSRDPDNFDAVLLKGRLFIAKNDATKAIPLLEHLASLYERSPQVHYFLAVASLLNDDATKAVKSVNRALTLNPAFDDAVLLLAQLDLSRGNSLSAITALNNLLKRQPNSLQGNLLAGAAYRAQGDLSAALAAYNRLTEGYPKAVEPVLLTGQIYMQQDRNDEARKSFAHALELAPGSFTALEYLVDLDLLEKEYKTALARVDPEVAKAPKTVELQLLLAKIYAAQTNIPAAEAALLKAIDINPELQQPYLFLARLYVDNGKNKQALKELEQALVKDPKDTKALMLMASIYEQVKDFSAARPAYEKLLAINAKFYPALNNLAYLYSEKFGELDKAYELARKARDLLAYKSQGAEDSVETARRNFTQFVRAFSSDTLGWVVYRRGDYPYALSLIEEAAEKLPGEPEVQYHLGMSCYMLGLEERARTALTLAASSDKEFTGKDEAIRRLATLLIDPTNASSTTIATLEQQLAKEPGDPIVLSRLSAAYERNRNPDKSLQIYQAALKENPKNVPVLISLARIYSSRNDSQGALKLAKEAYRLAPDDSSIIATLGPLVFKAGDYQWALSLLEQVKELKNADVLHDLAWAYYSVGRVDDSQTTMAAALQNNPSFQASTDAKSFLECVQASTDPLKAAATANHAKELLDSQSNYVPALMILAACSERNGDSPAARKYCERAVQLFPDFLPAVRELAILYANSGEEKAYPLAIKAREAFPQDPQIARAFGIASILRKDYASASRLLEESMMNGAGDAKGLYYLGIAHYETSKQSKDRAKEQQQSKQALQRALALNLTNTLAADARRILNELN